MEKEAAFVKFKELCAAKNLLQNNDSAEGSDDTESGISDDGTLLRFLRARNFDPDQALQQYEAMRTWRDANQLLQLYDEIEVADYEETRKLYTHWTGRRARNGSPLFLFDIGSLTSETMAAYNKSCSAKPVKPNQTESEATLRLFCTFENTTRFVLPLCSAIKSRPDPQDFIKDTTCIVDISSVSLMQFWRLRGHMQAASTLATAYYPETLGRTYIIGAPAFFPIVWSLLKKLFDQRTIDKLRVVPLGQEMKMLSEIVDPVNIPKRYGGEFEFEFGMEPDLDPEIRDTVEWWDVKNVPSSQNLPQGPMRWLNCEDGSKIAIAVGVVGGEHRNIPVLALEA